MDPRMSAAYRVGKKSREDDEESPAQAWPRLAGIILSAHVCWLAFQDFCVNRGSNRIRFQVWGWASKWEFCRFGGRAKVLWGPGQVCISGWGGSREPVLENRRQLKVDLNAGACC